MTPSEELRALLARYQYDEDTQRRSDYEESRRVLSNWLVNHAEAICELIEAAERAVDHTIDTVTRADLRAAVKRFSTS